MTYGIGSKHLNNVLAPKKYSKYTGRSSRETSSKNLNKSNNSGYKQYHNNQNHIPSSSSSSRNDSNLKNDVDKFMLTKRKLNKEFLVNAKNNNVERCLELIGASRKKH